MHPPTSDLRIRSQKPLIAPAVLEDELQLSDAGAELVSGARRDVARVISGTDDRLLVVVGPCSIHDPEAALDYARQLHAVVPIYARELVVLMRVYFE
ncbi:MAG: 3-deoxy-7-phosphoheptulonate synthase, partial [Candidatus Competibacter sp.]